MIHLRNQKQSDGIVTKYALRTWNPSRSVWNSQIYKMRHRTKCLRKESHSIRLNSNNRSRISNRTQALTNKVKRMIMISINRQVWVIRVRIRILSCYRRLLRSRILHLKRLLSDWLQCRNSIIILNHHLNWIQKRRGIMLHEQTIMLSHREHRLNYLCLHTSSNKIKLLRKTPKIFLRPRECKASSSSGDLLLEGDCRLIEQYH